MLLDACFWQRQLTGLDGGRKLVYGTDTGIFVSDRRQKASESRPRRVLEISSVTQVDIMEEYQLLLVLANKSLYSFSLEALDSNDTLVKRPKKIQGHANFFKAGVCMGRHLVCAAKMSGISTTIKVYEPTDTNIRNKKKPAIGRMFQGTGESLRAFKVGAVSLGFDAVVLNRKDQEFYVPAESTSIDFLRSKLCVACTRGFEVVSLETLETQPLLDNADTSLDFVSKKDNVPVSIERLNGEFLLHYTDFSFFVNRNGWRARSDWVINWEGRPTSFALSHPYLLAFEPKFLEIRHLETAALVYIITAKNLRMLHVSTSEVGLPFSTSRRRMTDWQHARSYTHTRTNLVRTLSPVWISGRGDRKRSIVRCPSASVSDAPSMTTTSSIPPCSEHVDVRSLRYPIELKTLHLHLATLRWSMKESDVVREINRIQAKVSKRPRYIRCKPYPYSV